MKIRRLSPTALPKIWGSTDTEPWYPRSLDKTGEVWFTAGEEPRLLVKFLFTSGKLSVQVHPPDSSAGRGKTEMWHVLRADAGAALALGLKRPLTRDEARTAALSGEIEGLLCWHHPRAGDTFFVPAGAVHAIGAGLALCEIQQNSDVTYRLYDYGRPRELHLDQGLAVADLQSQPQPVVPVDLGGGRRLLVQCPYFRTESLDIATDQTYTAGNRVELLICLEGAGHFDAEEFAAGQVWVVPRAAAPFIIHPRGKVSLLMTFAPD